jgi:hypothetical protein
MLNILKARAGSRSTSRADYLHTAPGVLPLLNLPTYSNDDERPGVRFKLESSVLRREGDAGRVGFLNAISSEVRSQG